MVQNNQKSRNTGPLAHLFSRTAYSFACSALLASLAHSASLIHLLAHSLPSSWGSVINCWAIRLFWTIMEGRNETTGKMRAKEVILRMVKHDDGDDDDCAGWRGGRMQGWGNRDGCGTKTATTNCCASAWFQDSILGQSTLYTVFSVFSAHLLSPERNIFYHFASKLAKTFLFQAKSSKSWEKFKKLASNIKKSYSNRL